MSTVQQVVPTKTDGLGPNGMWWVAWRQHRLALLVSGALLAVLVLALVAMRWHFTADYRAAVSGATCAKFGVVDPANPMGCQQAQDITTAYDLVWAWLRITVLGLPILLGALLGGPMVSQETERGTHVFALTQSVGRVRWYLTKCVVLLVPLIIGLLAVGLVAGWAAPKGALHGWNTRAIEVPQFQSTGTVPAALGLSAFGVAVAVSTFLRSVFPAVAVALALAAVAVIGLGYLLYPDLAPHHRVTSTPALADYVSVPDGAAFVQGGYLDTNGNEVSFPSCPALGQIPYVVDQAPSIYQQKYDAAFKICLQQAGITAHYIDYLDPSDYGRLVLTLDGICIALAAGGVAAGALRLRRRVL